jgi:hypothetical protein
LQDLRTESLDLDGLSGKVLSKSHLFLLNMHSTILVGDHTTIGSETMIANQMRTTLPYLVVEDEWMMRLRRKRDWALKSMPEEVLLPLLNVYRDHVYFIGLKRILIKILAGSDFKLRSNWHSGSTRSFFSTCMQNDTSREVGYSSRYQFKSNSWVNYGDRRQVRTLLLGTPFANGRVRRGKYIEYIAGDAFREFGRRAGRCEGGVLLMNRHDLTNEYSIHMGRDICTETNVCYRDPCDISLNSIIKDLLRGQDFILPPYGYSLQSLLGALTYKRHMFPKRFRLMPMDCQ